MRHKQDHFGPRRTDGDMKLSPPVCATWKIPVAGRSDSGGGEAGWVAHAALIWRVRACPHAVVMGTRTELAM